jgi:hypothetical protein
MANVPLLFNRGEVWTAANELGDGHDAQTAWQADLDGRIATIRIHVDEDYLGKVMRGEVPLKALTALLVHEGFHTMLDGTGKNFLYTHASDLSPEQLPEPFKSEPVQCVL